MIKDRIPFSAHWLHAVGTATAEKLDRITERIEYDKGDTVYAIGGPQRWLWAIEQGEVQIRLTLIETEPVLAHMYYTGAWFGESELIHNIDGIIDVTANTSTKMARVPYSSFCRIADVEPELWKALVLLTSMNQMLAMSAANDLTLRKSRSRLAAVLLRLSGMRNNFQRAGFTDTVRANQQEIADLSNLARSKASVYLREFEREGLVELNYNSVRILDPDGLSRDCLLAPLRPVSPLD